MDAFVVVLLSIHLIDKSLQVNFFKVYNLPLLHPELGVQCTYIKDGNARYIYLWSLYCYSTPHEILICLATYVYLSGLTTVWYPVDKIDWYVYDLFTYNHQMIDNHCWVDSRTRHTSLAINRDVCV